MTETRMQRGGRSKLTVTEALQIWAEDVSAKGQTQVWPEGIDRDSTVSCADLCADIRLLVERTPGYKRAENVLRMVYVDGVDPVTLRTGNQRPWTKYRRLIRFRLSLKRRIAGWSPPVPVEAVCWKEVGVGAATAATVSAERKFPDRFGNGIRRERMVS